MIEEGVGGAQLRTCPFQAFANPIVRDVLDLYRAARTGAEPGAVHLASVRILDPPAVVWEGLQVYASALARNLSELRAAEAQRNKKR